MSARRLAGVAAALALLGVLGALPGPASSAPATEDVVCRGDAPIDPGTAPRPPEVAAPGPEPLEPGSQESVRSYKVILTIEADGSLAVVERFTYDFGPATDRHGVVHDLFLTRGCSDGSQRTYPLRNLLVTSPSGASADVAVEEQGGVTRVRVGDPARPVAGVEEYVISYRLDGVVDTVGDHRELVWGFGSAWGVPVHHTVVRALPPEPVTAATCLAGPPGTAEPCAAMAVSDDLVLYEQPHLAPGSSLTVALALPPGRAEAAAAPSELSADAVDTQGGGWPVLAVAAGAAAVAAVVAAGAWALGARRRR